MSLIRTAFAGMAEKMELENALQLQKHQQLRPEQIRIQIAQGLTAIDEQLAADPKLKKRFDAVKLVLPTKG